MLNPKEYPIEVCQTKVDNKRNKTLKRGRAWAKLDTSDKFLFLPSPANCIY